MLIIYIIIIIFILYINKNIFKRGTLLNKIIGISFITLIFFKLFILILSLCYKDLIHVQYILTLIIDKTILVFGIPNNSFEKEYLEDLIHHLRYIQIHDRLKVGDIHSLVTSDLATFANNMHFHKFRYTNEIFATIQYPTLFMQYLPYRLIFTRQLFFILYFIDNHVPVNMFLLFINYSLNFFLILYILYYIIKLITQPPKNDA